MALLDLGARTVGRVVRITVTDDDINSVIEMGFDRLLVERSTDNGITWAEVTQGGDRPVLVKDTKTYTWIDRNGAALYYYRTRYFSQHQRDGGASVSDASSDPSEPIQGVGLITQNVLTVSQFRKRFLYGIDVRNDYGKDLDDDALSFYLFQAIEWMELMLDIPLTPTSFVEKQDYNRDDYEAYNFIQLDKYPVLSIEEFNVQYPTGQTVVVFPAEWLRIDAEHGHLRVVPTQGTLSEILIGQGGSYLPAIYNGLMSLPQLFEIHYTAGFDTNKIPTNIIALIGMMASLVPLAQGGDQVLGPGVTNMSLSIDGLSQSVASALNGQSSAFGARMAAYAKQIEDQLPKLVDYYKGIRMAVA